MATRKFRKFEGGGDINDDMYSDYGGKPMSTTEYTEPEVKPAKKAPIVTKEELAKSGLSLRDYMNKQQGLTRRGEPAMDTIRDLDTIRGAKPKETTVEKTVVKTEAPASTSPRVGRASQGMATSPEQKGVTAAGQAAANEKRAKQREGMFDKNPIAEIFKSIRKRGEETQGYAKGGAVSASKRADGIAQRGKTRGKIC